MASSNFLGGHVQHQDCPACPGGPSYVATMQVACRVCGGPTVPPTPGHPEERGYVCDDSKCTETTDG